MPITKEISDMLDIDRKPSQVISVVCYHNKIAIAQGKCSHGAMALDYYFRSQSTAPSHRIIALWVHPFSHREAIALVMVMGMAVGKDEDVSHLTYANNGFVLQ